MNPSASILLRIIPALAVAVIGSGAATGDVDAQGEAVEDWYPWNEGAGPSGVNSTNEESLSDPEDADWWFEAGRFIEDYYPRSHRDSAGGGDGVAFTVELAPFPVEVDRFDLGRSDAVRRLTRDPTQMWTEDERARALMRRHLQPIDYLVFNRWTLPTTFSVWGGFSAPSAAAERAVRAERRERDGRLTRARVEAVRAAAWIDPQIAERMRQDWIEATGEDF